jgi:hypothetical protein
MEARWGIERKKTNRYVCNQWQVGNFLTQKQVKAGGRVLSSLYYAKAVFGCGFGWQPTPLVACWLLAKEKGGKKSQTKGTLSLQRKPSLQLPFPTTHNTFTRCTVPRQATVRLVGGWLPVLIYSEKKIPLTVTVVGLF